jgi:hypothetical protein
MSFDHWWIGAFVDDDSHPTLRSAFAATVKKAALSEQSQQALEAWRRHPRDFEQHVAISGESAARANAFIWAFNLPGFDRLAEQMATQSGAFADFALEDHLFRMMVCARHTPVSILWHALGHQRAGLLPGKFGNLLLSATEIAQAEQKTRQAYAGISPQELRDKARAFCGWSVDEERLGEVLHFLPDALAQARELGQGFLALARPQL